jgi:ADP-ribose pyrophosphatase YjhB (NUDIX family)
VETSGQVIKAMVLIRRPRDGALLVSEHADPAAAPFHRPLGGHVEFGEYALDTVNREFEEELGQSLTGVRLLGVLENIFQWDGATQHEIVLCSPPPLPTSPPMRSRSSASWIKQTGFALSGVRPARTAHRYIQRGRPAC